MDGRHQLARSSALLITEDEHIHREVMRAAAAAHVTVDVVTSAVDAEQRWEAASLVLVGSDRIGPASRLRLTRRRDVLVVHAGAAPPEVFRTAFELGAARVQELPSPEVWLPDALAEAEVGGRREGVVVGFVSASGGSGASSLAVATACLGVARATTALVDVDPLGVGIERLIGYEGPSVTTWATLGARGLSPTSLRDSLPVHDGVHLVGFGGAPLHAVTSTGVAAVLDACRRAFGLTVVDLPRSPDPATRAAFDRCDLVVVACRQSVGAAVAGSRLLASLPSVRAMAVTRSGPRTVDAGDLSAALQIPLLAEVRDQRGLDEVMAGGVGPLRSRGSGLRRAAQAVLDQVKLAA